MKPAKKKASKSKAKRARGGRPPTLKDLVEAASAAGMDVKPYLEPIVRVPVTARMAEDLTILASIGLFGNSPEEAARHILEEWLWHNMARIQSLRA